MAEAAEEAEFELWFGPEFEPALFEGGGVTLGSKTAEPGLPCIIPRCW